MNVTLIIKINAIVFENEQNFKIMRAEIIEANDQDLKIDKNFSIKGICGSIIIGETYKLTGEQIKDAKYGWQIVIEKIKHHVASNKNAIVKYLSSSLFAKIGRISAGKIVDTLGEDCINLIEQNPQIVENELKFLSKEQQEIIKNGILQNVYIEKIFLFFENILSIEQATKIFLDEGIECLEKYQQNPYLLYFNYERILLPNLDAFALNKKLVDYNSQNRLEAIIYKYLKELRAHTYVNIATLKKHLQTQKITNLKYLELALETLQSKKLVKKINEDELAYYVNYQYEKNIAFKLKVLNSYSKSQVQIQKHIEDLQFLENIEYVDKQIQAITNVFNNNVSVITGGPGTGKTTIINAICKIHKRLDPISEVVLIAPTGKAATRMSEVTKQKAVTIHSLLGIGIGDTKAKFNAFNNLDAKLVILDEASMVDIEVFSKLVDALKNDTTLVIVGDVNQLSSVGPGQVLSDIIDSNLFKVTKLEVIKRQNKFSNIITLASDVLQEKLNKEMFKIKKSDFEYYQINDNQTFKALEAIVQKELVNFSKDDIQIISPRRTSYNVNMNSSVNKINQFIQPILNPNQDYLYKNINQKFYLNDRIINNENMLDKNIANGDQGYLVSPVFNRHKKLEKIGILFDDIVEFNAEELKQIDLAYATTVHKAQGSEYKLVILFLLPQHGTLVSKKLIYTAITRAKEKIIICGNFEYIQNAIKNKEQEIRHSKLMEYLGENNG